MNFSDFKECMKKALEDKEIRKIIREISFEEDKKNKSLFSIGDEKVKNFKEENKNLINENEKLKEQIEELFKQVEDLKRNSKEQQEYYEEKNSSLKNEKNSLENEVKNIKEEIKKLNALLYEKDCKLKEVKEEISDYEDELILVKKQSKKYKDRLLNYENTYEELEKYFKKFNNLSTDIEQSLERVIKGNSAELFLASGVQRDNLDELWDYISYYLNKLSSEEIETLKEIFEYLFKKYNEINKVLVFDDIHIGDEFDEEIHTRGKDSRISGGISEIQLIGYKYIKSGKIIKKSIVKI